MGNNALEILRIKKLMGLKSSLKEGFYGLNKLLLNEETGYGEAMQIMKSLVKKTTQQLSDLEKVYLKNMIEDFNQKYGDEYGALIDEGKMTDLIRTNLTRMLDEVSDDETINFFNTVIQRVTRGDIATAGLNSVTTMDDAFRQIMDGTMDNFSRTNSDGSVVDATFLDSLRYIYRKGGISNSDLPEELINELEGKIMTALDDIPADNPMGKYLTDLKDQIDELSTGESKLPSTDEVIEIKNNLDSFKTNLENPITPLVIKDPDIEIEIGNGSSVIDDAEQTLGGQTAEEMDKNMRKAFVEGMRKSCKSRFCSTMTAYYYGAPEKFEAMWEELLIQINDRIKVKISGDVDPLLDKELLALSERLKVLQSGKKIFTRDDYVKIGEAVWKKWKSGTFLEKFSLGGLFGTKEQGFYTIARTFLGQDVYSGKFLTRSELIKRWAVINGLILTYHVGETIYEVKFGNNDPNKSDADIIKDGIDDIAKDALSLVGGPPVWRLVVGTLGEAIEFFMPSSTYVNEEDLVEWIKEDSKTRHAPGYTDLEVYDNLINNTGVTITYDSESKTPSTVVKGITDPGFIYYNGTYTQDKTGEYTYKINFRPEGSKTATKQLKSKGVDKAIIDQLESTIATNSAISSFIKDRLTGIVKSHKKWIDYEKQFTQTTDKGTEELLVFSWKDNLEGTESKFMFNYTKWKNDGSLDLKDAVNWNKYVGEYKGN